MLSLTPMTQADYDDYLATAATTFASEKVKAGTWNEQLAFQRASETYQRLLPNGIKTPDNYFYRIDQDKTKVGVLWLAKSHDNPEAAFIYDLYIFKDYQNQGIGTEALQLADDEARQLGFKRIALHVFGHNERALHVYQKSGFEITDINLEKPL
ncbi:GNAT family N-acetyltransferase [Lentilactobacillus parafarraginis]|jgi:RimJ/RimL family protein N-acetyltransferase|uniref:Acetyltransferase, GNAT family n=2 Tax=Lentilactobacillus parafarraginis TaxID=390842 RepID=A0A0R1YQA8_9LACO|nr:GNAT family N-acetyltransferase [Lentilactobacillus parafarraginis]KRM44401.1 acetyltransferase, GNAT family [Lentilactobacillus parafarraginis DSM 18390 = JCM 14109]TLQ17421.1 GNAT family N-acetyltransferase [Lentilactobacillus parafarraginis]